MVLSPHVVVTEVIGSFVSDAIDTVKPPIQQLMARSGAAHVFWDAEGLESHDGPVRDEFVGLFRNNRSQWAGLHVLFRSALIGMTVGAVGLLFRGALKGHRDRDSFRKAIDAALASE
ncbi:MAG: hypothetical protein H6712_14040 [Myxococcales bacterium]|nr:hypothetical protein [Myxococcales bacterium]MCB9714983.1 hypothetical protein [Myxococcales bacterium]